MCPGGILQRDGCTRHQRHKERIGGDGESEKSLEACQQGYEKLRISLLTVKPLVHVHGTMQKVLPCIDHKDSKGKLSDWNQVPVYGTRCLHLPIRECRYLMAGDNVKSCSQRRIFASCKRTSKKWMRNSNVLGDGGSIQSQHAQELRQSSLCNPDSLGPHCNGVFLVARHFFRLCQTQHGSNNGLDDLLNDDIACDFVS